MGGTVLAPAAATCRSGRTIDMVLLDNRLLSKYRGPFVDSDWPLSLGHAPCWLSLDIASKSPLIPRYIRPAAFPVDPVIGPIRNLLEPGGQLVDSI